jgi:predicted porin
MKKSLLAVAAIGAFASAAQAQSSVTVYGILDVGFAGVTTRAGAEKTNKTSFTGEGPEQTSRLGFRGTEDLGGGTSAFFTAEFALAPTDATLSGSTANGLQNRQTFVGLKKNGVGSAAIGTQYSPVHLAVGRTDPGQQNNMLGNVIYTTNASQGNGQTTTAYTVRYNNALTLQTDRFAGFQAYGLYNNNNSNKNNPNTTQTVANNEALAIGVNYVWNKLNLDYAMNSSKQQSISGTAQDPSAIAASATAGQVNFPANPLGTSLGILSNYAGATYDFGILKAYAQYINTKYTSSNNSNIYVQRAAQQIGVRSFVTPTIEAWASAGTGTYRGPNSTTVGTTQYSSTANFTGYQLGSNYWLSKRTNMYAIFGSTQSSTNGSIAAEGGSSYGVGVRHTF